MHVDTDLRDFEALVDGAYHTGFKSCRDLHIAAFVITNGNKFLHREFAVKTVVVKVSKRHQSTILKCGAVCMQCVLGLLETAL